MYIHSLNFRLYQFGLLYRNCKFTRMIISFRYTYVCQAHLRNRLGRAASQKNGCGEEREARSNEPIIDHTKQSWYSSNASSALTSEAEPNRSILFYQLLMHIQDFILK
ncbi:Hypothetical_protein [Hexamita inflata]|uniref:Hypothetical_protein n=1 Tax=Hexamita inflata TaxID=28002 RepID=A0AA86UKN7_9EUKA|nr:Hypothetical protein HINF_LOCUS42886 [Hexamita inflata]